VNPGGGGGFIGGGRSDGGHRLGQQTARPIRRWRWSELDGLYSYVDRTHNKLYMMFTGI